jgi:V8-like Glu-specific endopeptidase
MKKWKSLLTLGLIATVMNTQAVNKVIYGDDNRRDVYDTSNAQFINLSKSTAAMIDSSRLVEEGENFKVEAEALGERRNLCEDEPFYSQPAAANCSGFLVGPNLLVTAGHCVSSLWGGEPSCKSYKWVFDYNVDYEGKDQFTIPKSNVYACKSILSYALDRTSNDDFALIELERDVTDREPLEVRTEGKIADKSPLVVIGHPWGLPTKIADGANVRNNDDGVFFNANLDTYGGNSGSAVFNAETGKVEGILVRGAQDDTRDPRGCTVSNRCANDECRGEDVTRITNIPELMERLSNN